jgi:hypothetical protein
MFEKRNLCLEVEDTSKLDDLISGLFINIAVRTILLPYL